MNTMIVIYVSCVNKEEAVKIGDVIMKKRLAPCYNILSHTTSAAFWPPNSGKVERVEGAVLLVKTIEKKYQSIEKEVRKLHSDTNPCIFQYQFPTFPNNISIGLNVRSKNTDGY